MIGYLTANGRSSKDFNVYLTDAGVYTIAERDTTNMSIPGKNGDLILDNGRFKNVKHSYPCVIVGDFATNFSAFIGYLVSQAGYIRIEDSFHPDEFIMAKYTGATNPRSVYKSELGVFEIPFLRKPQRYLLSGEIPITFTANGELFNEDMPAKPIVRVYGTGTVGIGNDTITITSANEYTDIDCETQNAYKGTTNCNGNIVLNSGKFFELKNGVSGVSIGSGITRVEITPKWWRL